MTERRPTDLELMQYADGELPPDRAIEVERHIQSDPRARAVVAGLVGCGAIVREAADRKARACGADSIADMVMASIDAPPRAAQRPMSRAPASRALPDSRKRVVFLSAAVAGLAMAATIALFLGRLDSNDANRGAVLDRITNSSRSTPSPIESTSNINAASSSEDDPEQGVSIDAIDFGAHAGAIFYVPTDHGMTAVVWLSDDDAEGAGE